MPIPLIIAGLAAAGIGALGHIGAKEMNEEAERLSRKAQRIYNEENTNLQMVRTKTETALQNLGNTKNVVLNTSLIKFVNAYEKFKDIQFTESEGIYELSNFTIEKQDAIQLREMSNIYQSAFKTGAITAVAAGGIATVAGVAASPLAVVAADLWEDVECSVGLADLESGCLAAELDDELLAALEGEAHVLNALL